MVNLDEFDPNEAVLPVAHAIQRVANEQARAVAQMSGMAEIIQEATRTLVTPGFIDGIRTAVRVHDEAVRSISTAVGPLIEAQALAVHQATGFAASMQQSIDALNRSVLPQLANMTALANQLSAFVAPAREAFIESLAQVNWAALAERVTDLVPQNWSGDVQYEEAMVIINDEGIPLIWVPRAEVVELLVSSKNGEARRAVLTQQASSIIADVRICLDEAEDVPALAEHVYLVRESASAFEAGFVNAAQALATDVLDSLVMAYIGNHAKVHKRIQPISDEVLAGEFVKTASLSPLLQAYQPYWADRGDPMPTRYNRHATVHGGSTIQFTPANAVVALMLVTSFLRNLAEVER